VLKRTYRKGGDEGLPSHCMEAGARMRKRREREREREGGGVLLVFVAHAYCRRQSGELLAKFNRPEVR